MNFDIKNIDNKSVERGFDKIEWAKESMPVLNNIRKRFEKEKPLKNINIGACLHVTTETAVLMQTLKAGGANISLCASNPLSTQDDVASSLVKNDNISVYAINGENIKTYNKHLTDVIESNLNITMDDGADLISSLHSSKRNFLHSVFGGTEETTTGVIRLKNMAANNVLNYPVIAVNDAKTKHFFDNRYGTGQSTIDGIIRATNRLIAGSTFVVCGYGWCGKGLAMRARGMGANVIVTEIDPLVSLEAVMDGFRVMPIKEASFLGDFFCTVTGNKKVISINEFNNMKDGAIVCNSGHFDVELDIKALIEFSKGIKEIRNHIQQFTLNNGKKINVLGEGRLINLASAEGHPSSVMDMSFANQALCAEYLVKNRNKFDYNVLSVPEEIDNKIAKEKLKSMKVNIDTLTNEQQIYLNSWTIGTLESQ